VINLAQLKQIVDFLDNELNTASIKDRSINGLQVDGSQEVRRIGFAVDASMEALNRARDAYCDMLIVHHGIIWDRPDTLTGNLYKRAKFLIQNNISLYASHLPLDKHEIYGNNAHLARLLNLRNLRGFGDYNGNPVGFAGELGREMEFEELIREAKEKLNTKITALPFGKRTVGTVAVVSGNGNACLKEAIAKGFDVFFTGETSHTSFHEAKDGAINVIFAGHYATETLGLKALAAELKQKFELEAGFIDIPTGL